MSRTPANTSSSERRVEPDARDRSMEVIADSAEFYRSSTTALEGDRAPRAIAHRRTMMVESTPSTGDTTSLPCSLAWTDTAARLHTRRSTWSSRRCAMITYRPSVVSRVSVLRNANASESARLFKLIHYRAREYPQCLFSRDASRANRTASLSARSFWRST